MRSIVQCDVNHGDLRIPRRCNICDDVIAVCNERAPIRVRRTREVKTMQRRINR